MASDHSDPPCRRSDQASQVRMLFDRSIAMKREVAERHADTIVGDSAADAQDLAAEILVRLRPAIDRDALPALSLATDMSSLTACANDYSYDAYFERLTTALGRRGDVLIGITTSGSSASVVRALQAARPRGMLTIGLLGCEGQPALEFCDLAVVVPSNETGRIQESHITIGHALLELVEDLCLEHQSAGRWAHSVVDGQGDVVTVEAEIP